MLTDSQMIDGDRDRVDMSYGNVTCGKEGHLRPYCPNPKKTSKDLQKTQESSKPDAKVATVSVVETVSDDEGAWAAELVEVGTRNDWFEEAIQEEMLKEKNDDFEVVADVEFKLIENVVEELGDLYSEALIVAESVQASAKAKLYDSGCMNHISPYKESFENFQVIETRHFRAANKQTFSTIGKGDLVIDIPSDNGTMQFRLQEVLYSPEVVYMLVSIGHLDEDGFLVTFGGGKCTIRDGNKEVVGVI